MVSRGLAAGREHAAAAFAWDRPGVLAVRLRLFVNLVAGLSMLLLVFDDYKLHAGG